MVLIRHIQHVNEALHTVIMHLPTSHNSFIMLFDFLPICQPFNAIVFIKIQHRKAETTQKKKSFKEIQMFLQVEQRENNSILSFAQQCHLTAFTRRGKMLSTNLCQSRIEMACNSGSLTVTDLEMICFTDRVKQRK